MRTGGPFTGNAEALVGRCTTLAVESGIDYHRHLQNLDAAHTHPAQCSLFAAGLVRPTANIRCTWI